MPVRTNITGVWRVVKLSNIIGVGSNVLSTGTLIGDVANPLSGLYLVLEKAEFENQMDVSPMQLTQGTAKTKVLDIRNSTDSLNVSGPMLFASQNIAPTATPNPIVYPVLAAGSNIFGDASTVAVAYLNGALDPTNAQNSYAESITISLDENGASFNTNIKGDPTSLYPNFSPIGTTVVPLGSDVPDLPSALRKGQWYDFYVEASITMATGGDPSGANPTFAKVDTVGAVKSMSYNIQIGADPFNLLGRGQAPWFAIKSIAMTCNMTLVFPLLNLDANYTRFNTPLVTAQHLPGPWGPEYGDSSPLTTPSGLFPERPDYFTIDTIDLSPKYKANGENLLDPSVFGMTSLDDISGVIQRSKVSLSGQLITSELEFQVVFA